MLSPEAEELLTKVNTQQKSSLHCRSERSISISTRSSSRGGTNRSHRSSRSRRSGDGRHSHRQQRRRSSSSGSNNDGDESSSKLQSSAELHDQATALRQSLNSDDPSSYITTCESSREEGATSRRSSSTSRSRGSSGRRRRSSRAVNGHAGGGSDSDRRGISANSVASRSAKADASRSTLSSSRTTRSTAYSVIDPHADDDEHDHEGNNEGDGQQHYNDDYYEFSSRSKKLSAAEEVDKYLAIARRKASLMTNHDFESYDDDDNDDDGGDDDDGMERGHSYFDMVRGGGDHSSKKSPARSSSASRKRRSKKHTDNNSVGSRDDDKRSSSRSRNSSSPSASSSASRRRRRFSNHKHISQEKKEIQDSSSNDDCALRSKSKSSSPRVEPQDEANDDDAAAAAAAADETSAPITIPGIEELRLWGDHHHHQDDDDEYQNPLPPNMTGRSIGDANHTTVSSMTSTDSYVKKQLYVRELRRAEFEVRRKERVEQKKQAQMEGYFDDDATYVVEEGDEGNLPDSFCGEDNIRSHVVDDDDDDDDDHQLYDDLDEPYYDDRRGLCASARSNIRPRDINQGKAAGTSQRRSYSDAPRSHRRTSGSQYSVMGSPPRRRSHDSSSNNESSNSKNRRTSSFHSSGHTTVASPPVYQREECCIKHPHILLQNQTDVDIWTCMRYCKDPITGRWNTKKMVCEECLDEEEDAHGDDPVYHRKFRRDLHAFQSSGTRRLNALERSIENLTHAHHDHDHDADDDDVTCSTSSETRHHSPSTHEDNTFRDKINKTLFRETTNVHPSMAGNQTPLEREAEAQQRRFVRRLAARAYHFPGNSWVEDLIQYTSNTHLIFGIFFHHPLHPVAGRERFVILLGSVAVGLLMSNLIYLWFVHYEIGMDDTVLSLGPSGSLEVTKLMITLWTLGSTVHTLFDLSVWHIKACTFCRYGYGNYVSDDAVKCGRTAGMTIVLITFAFATYLVLLRASEDYKDSELYSQLHLSSSDEQLNEDGNVVDGESFIQPISLGGGAKYFEFILGYIIEFVLAVFVYNPLILTIVFTGVLGCNGRIPVLGGRPREEMRERRHAMKRQRYTMPQTLKLGDDEYEADTWGDSNQKLATNF